MKDQYFGDINDYRKYGLLRTLSGAGEIGTGICWMLTPSDGRTDGQMLRYLEQPGRWRHLDPELFDHLQRCVIADGERDVRRMDGPVLPRTSFYSQLLEDKADARQRYFAEMLAHFRDVDLIFFDPDNGFEVLSRPLGRKNSNKHLYWHEFAETYAAGHSVLVYQHFVRENRIGFVRRVAERMRVETNAPNIYAFVTSHVVFLLAPRPEHLAHLDRQASLVPVTWEEQIRLLQPFKENTSTEPPPETA